MTEEAEPWQMAALKALGAAPAPPGPSLATPAQQARPPAPKAGKEELPAVTAGGAARAAAGAAAAAPTSVAANLQAALAAAAAVEQPLFQPQQLLGAAGLPGAGMPAAGIPGLQPWMAPSLAQAFGASQPAAPATQLLSQQQAVLFSQQAVAMQLSLPTVKQEPVEGTSPAGRPLAAVKREPSTAATGAAAALKQEPGIVVPGAVVPAVKREPGAAGGRSQARGRAGGRGRGRAAAAAAAQAPPRAAKGRRQVVSDSSESESEESASSSSSSSSSEEESEEEEEYEPPPRRGRRPAAAAKAAPAPRKRGRPPGKAAAGRGRANAAAAAVASDEEEAAAPKKRARKGAGHIDAPALVEGGWTLDPHTPLIYRDVGGSGSKVAAFTLDGTICLTKMGLPYAGSASDWMYAYPGVPERLAQLQQEGFLVVIMNNQGNVKGALNGKASANARGKVDAILDSMAMHGVDGTRVKVLLAPSMEALRKPDPGMWHFLANRLNSGVTIDKSQSFYVGDSDGDSGFASAVGLSCFRPASFFKGSGSGGAAVAGLNEGLIDMFKQIEEMYVLRGEPATKLSALRQARQVVASTAYKIKSSADLQGVCGIGPVTSKWIDEYCRYGCVEYLRQMQEEMADDFY